jgi:glycosyltransferase involved in cell wall biosynthesis
MRLLVFNLATDADDPILGFTTGWLNALAARVEAVDVITMRAGRLALAPNVRVFSLGKENGYSEPQRGLRFYRLLSDLLLKNRYDAAFFHMTELFAVMAAPLLRLRGVPSTLWYAHKSVTRNLQMAEKLVKHVVTASPESFRIASKKTIITGHGIDTDLFAPLEDARYERFTVMTVGRVAPVKGLVALIDAARMLNDVPDLHIAVVGAALPGDEAYAAGLRNGSSDLGERFEWVGALSNAAVAARLPHSSAFVNLSSTGSLDKAVLEAMACGVPVITANEAFRDLLAPWSNLLLIPPGDSVILAERVRMLAAMSLPERVALGKALRQIILNGHSLNGLADRLVALFTIKPKEPA